MTSRQNTAYSQQSSMTDN